MTSPAIFSLGIVLYERSKNNYDNNDYFRLYYFMIKVNLFTNSAFQTKRAGRILAQEILGTSSKKTALVIGLVGELGSGKTTFLQGFAKGLGIREKIISPTFIIIKRFKVSRFRFQGFYHIDYYRIKNSKEILDLGLKKIISNPRNVVAVEWADRIKKILPKNTAWIYFKTVDLKTRKITIKQVA